MSSNVDAYTRALTKNRTPVTPADISKANISKNIHRPLDEIIGRPVDSTFIEEYNQDTEKTGITLPLTKYVGPGNSLNLGTPNSHADEVAQRHDLQYAYATHEYNEGRFTEKQFKDYVQYADLLSVQQFNEGQDFGDTLGKFGIAAKQAFEAVTGQIYPSTGNYGLI